MSLSWTVAAVLNGKALAVLDTDRDEGECV